MLSTPRQRAAGLALGVVLTLAALVASIALGVTSMSMTTVIEAFLHYDPADTDHIIVHSERLSRAVIAVVVGAGLAVAGALMQALTRNALASPGILGVNAGAMFFVVSAASVLTLRTPADYVWVAFIGAAVAGAIVYVLGSSRSTGVSPMRIVLAGVAVSALFVSFSQGLLVINQERLESILFWIAGSVSGRRLDAVLPLLPFFAAAALVCVGLARQLNVLVLDEELAKGLGQRALLVQMLAGATVVVLAGGSVAIAGMIGFVGLIVPHMARALFGMDHRWVLPACALLGASLLLLADTLARFLIPPQEVPVGVMTALLGTPFFVYLARRKGHAL
ncbi:FecCD family ABC transporter permease [Arhodomonas sp. AD133]|uniref:FecCD family ABC transporter permease n=1 Tax=Arhodomonas sp. AD133 TaxID=3415009 RepID=UPI003EBD3A7D